VAPELAGPTGYDATLRGELLAALAALPDEERRLVTGVYVEGHTYQEMADRSGVALGTLKRRLRDGLAGLRTRLSERDPSALDPDRSHPLEPEPRGSDDPDSGGGETSRS
jgi:DNA-directed RNA polymerase specialized sigma24 family protein